MPNVSFAQHTQSLLAEMVILPAKDVDDVEIGDEVDGLQWEPAGAEHHHHRDQHAVRPLSKQETRTKVL